MSFEPTDRELCPDGACIGLIGPDGRCRECGTVAPSAHTHSRLRGMRLDSDGEPSVNSGELEPAIDDDGVERELCPDGACIGLIGADGRCRECGRAGERGGERGGSSSAAPSPSAGKPDADDAPGEEIDDRELCPDGMCIGVIGANRRCKVCGRAAE